MGFIFLFFFAQPDSVMICVQVYFVIYSALYENFKQTNILKAAKCCRKTTLCASVRVCVCVCVLGKV